MGVAIRPVGHSHIQPIVGIEHDSSCQGCGWVDGACIRHGEAHGWQGRVLVDATNPLAPGLAGLSLGTTTSGAEQVAERARGAHVVKAFNSTGAENMADSRYAQGQPMMPVAGDDASARQQVLALATLIGFDAIDMGALSAARYLEPLAMVWIHLAFKQGQGRRFAFARMTRA